MKVLPVFSLLPYDSEKTLLFCYLSRSLLQYVPHDRGLSPDVFATIGKRVSTKV